MSKMSELYPLKFSPIYKAKIWGGRNLQRLFGRSLPAGEKIGESWELADLDEGVSVVANGPAAGATLTELVADWRSDLLGPARAMDTGRFPLLLKFLDANDILSLQVHPDRQAAAEIGPPAALKTECWYVVESRDGVIYKGVQPGVSPEQFRRAIDRNVVDQLVRKIPVSAGDFHYLPAGTVHALGAGLVVAEVQTPSDTTYRVTDWGRGREIDIDRSMQCIRFELGDCQPGAAGDTLLATEYFTVALRQVAAQGLIEMPAGRCTAMMILAGRGAVTYGRGARPVRFQAGDTLLLPAGLQAAYSEALDPIRYLEIELPGTK